MVEEVIHVVEADGGDARAELRRLFAVAVSIDDMVRIEFAIREWGPPRGRRRSAAEADRQPAHGLHFSGLGLDDGDVEARSLTAFSLFIANRYIATDHGERSRADVIAIATQHLVEEG